MRRNGDENLFVKFYMGSVQDVRASEAAGHPVHIEKPFIEIHIPGDPHNITDTVAKPYYQQRFADEWKQFTEHNEQGQQGWLLKTWPQVTAAQVKNLEFLNVHTVEQLAGLTDAQCQKVGMGAEDLRAKAKAAVAAAKDGAAHMAQALENKRLNEEMEALRNQMTALLQAQAEKPKVGRPRKEEADA